MPLTRIRTVRVDELLGGLSSFRRSGSCRKQARKLPAGQSGHRTLPSTSCGHFTFFPNMLCSSELSTGFPQPVGKFSTRFPQMAIHFPRKVLSSQKIKWLKKWDKKYVISRLSDVRNAVSSREISFCGKLPSSVWNHAQYTPYVCARVTSTAPTYHICNVT